MKKAAGVAPVLMSVLLLAGCGGGGSEEAGPGSADTEASEPSGPSESPSPAVEPATGPPIKAEEVTIRTPQGYGRAETWTAYALVSRGPGEDFIGVGQAPVYEQLSDRAIARSVAKGATWGGTDPARGENVLVDGVSMVHLHGPNGLGQYNDAFSAVVGDHLVELRFSLGGRPEARQEVVDSVLATVEWRD